jgi:hypothetical protein
MVEATSGVQVKSDLFSAGSDGLPYPAASSMTLGYGNSLNFYYPPTALSNIFMLGALNSFNFSNMAANQVNNNYLVGYGNVFYDDYDGSSQYRNYIFGSSNQIAPTTETADTHTFGNNNTVRGSQSYILGQYNDVTGGYALGTTNTVGGGGGVAIGDGNYVNAASGIAIGTYAQVPYNNSIVISGKNRGGYATASTLDEISLYGSGGVRLITGVESTGAPRFVHKFVTPSTNDATNFVSGWDSKMNLSTYKGLFLLDHSTNGVTADANYQVKIRAIGGYKFLTGTTELIGAQLPANGGSWSSLSDRDSKENLRPVDSRNILEKVAALPVTTWNYKAQGRDIRHMGPMAQDFYASFGIGEDEKHIGTVDSDGVALAAIKGLYEENKALKARVEALEKEKQTFDARLSRLEDSAKNRSAGGSGGSSGGGVLGWLLAGSLILGGVVAGRRRI